MRLDAVPKQGFGFFSEEMEGETLLYRLGAHKAIHLNASAALVWKLCDGSRTVQDIIELLRAEYPGVDLAADVEESIEQLMREGALLESAASDSTNS